MDFREFIEKQSMSLRSFVMGLCLPINADTFLVSVSLQTSCTFISYSTFWGVWNLIDPFCLFQAETGDGTCLLFNLYSTPWTARSALKFLLLHGHKKINGSNPKRDCSWSSLGYAGYRRGLCGSPKTFRHQQYVFFKHLRVLPTRWKYASRA